MENGAAEWKVLSVENSTKQPQIVFNSRRNLDAVLADRIVRRKIVFFLRDGFQWLDSIRIELFDDFMPYSLTFREIKNGKTALSSVRAQAAASHSRQYYSTKRDTDCIMLKRWTA